MRITSNTDTINAIVDALKSCSFGLIIASKSTYEVSYNGYSSSIEFTPIDGCVLDPQDFFWLGKVIGSDYKLD